MRVLIIAGVALAAVVLGGCNRSQPSTSAPTHHGRYVGVGLYSPAKLWSKMVLAAGGQPQSASARTGDDDEIIVVVDSDTGEIRQCGNLSGYCVGMNPWTKALTAEQTEPINVSEHTVDWTPDAPPAASGEPPPAPH